MFELAYSADGSLQSAATPDRRLRRDSLSAGILDFQLTKDGTLVLTLESGLEMYTFPGGRRVTLGGEGTLSRYDHRDRLSTQDHLDGGRVLLTYDSETASSATRQELAGNKRPREGTASLDIALDHPAAHGETFTEALDGVLGYDFRPATVREVDRPAARRGRLGRAILGCEHSHRRRNECAGESTQNEGARAQPELPDVVGDEGRVSLLLDDRVAHVQPFRK